MAVLPSSRPIPRRDAKLTIELSLSLKDCDLEVRASRCDRPLPTVQPSTPSIRRKKKA